MAEEAANNVYDIVVIGGGPAGASAAINAVARRRSVLVLEANTPFARVRRSTHAVNNYLGLPGVTGPQLADAYQRHVESLGVPYVRERATQVVPDDDGFTVFTDHHQYRGRTLILAGGLVRGGGLPGEQQLLGRGVSYCATCDGLFFAGKPVVVVGEYAEAEHDVLTLSQMASEVRYLPLYGEPTRPLPGVTVLQGRPEAVVGEDRVRALRVSGQEVAADGIFIIRPALPPASICPGLAMEGSYVRTGRDQATNVSGVFAAGDITGPPFQYAKSVGEGQIAALSADRWLQGKPAPALSSTAGG